MYAYIGLVGFIQIYTRIGAHGRKIYYTMCRICTHSLCIYIIQFFLCVRSDEVLTLWSCAFGCHGIVWLFDEYIRTNARGLLTNTFR